MTTLVNWMKNHLIDAQNEGLSELINCFGCGEVNATRLAEECAYDSGLFVNPDDVLDDETHEIWDAAIDAAEWYENK